MPNARTVVPVHARAELRGALAKFVARRVPSADADDVLQEIYLRVQQGLARVLDEERVTAWIYQVARNTIADHFRRRRPVADSTAEMIEIDAPEDDAGSELASVLSDFVALLPATHREAIELTELGGVTQATAAAQLALSVPGMKSRVQRARAQLRQLLEACCEVELDARCRVVSFAAKAPPAALPSCCAKR